MLAHGVMEYNFIEYNAQPISLHYHCTLMARVHEPIKVRSDNELNVYWSEMTIILKEHPYFTIWIKHTGAVLNINSYPIPVTKDRLYVISTLSPLLVLNSWYD